MGAESGAGVGGGGGEKREGVEGQASSLMKGREGVQWKGEMGPDKALKKGESDWRRLGEERGMVEICQKRAPD